MVNKFHQFPMFIQWNKALRPYHYYSLLFIMALFILAQMKAQSVIFLFIK